MEDATLEIGRARDLLLSSDSGDWDAAGGILEAALDAVWGDPEMLDASSELLLKAARFESARKAAARWVELDNSEDSLCRLGECLRELSRYEDAILQFQRALRKNRACIQALCGAGSSLISAGYVVEGLMSVSQALHQDEKSDQAHRALAIGLLRQGSVDQAESAAGEALGLAPDSSGNVSAMGLVRMRQGRMQEAEELLRRSVELRPLYAEGWANLGFVLRSLGRNEEAVEALGRSAAIKPYKSATYNSLGHALRAKGDLEGALGALRKACEMEPRRPDYLTNLGAVLTDMRRYGEALDTLRDALRIDKNHLPARSNLPMLYSLAGRLDMALAEARELVKRHPEFAGGHHNLAAVCNKLDRLDEAEAEAKRAVELGPKEQKHHLTLAEVLKRKGELDKALGAARTALSIEDNAKARFRLGLILRERGETAAAVDQFRRCLEQDPEDNEGASMFLAALEGSESPKAAPPAYIRRVFDSYAARFDEHLVKGLRYEGPKRYMEALEPHLDRREGLYILDLGCGTGLCGKLLRPLADCLEGVDLSERMVEQAERTGLYDDLEAADAIQALSARQDVDVVVAGDLLIYFGDLSPVFSALAGALAPGGLFVGNVEALEDGVWKVNPAGRFSHSEAYLRETVSAAGLKILSLESAFLREEDKKPVPGYVMVLQAAASDLG